MKAVGDDSEMSCRVAYPTKEMHEPRDKKFCVSEALLTQRLHE
jgi:hypothetical protein